MRSARNWLSWNLLTAYDRLLRAVSLEAVRIAIAVNSRRKELKPLLAEPALSPDEQWTLLMLGFEPVLRR